MAGIETVAISAMGPRGEGIAEHDGRRVFVAYALPGERVAIHADGQRGHLDRIIDPSPERVVAGCPHFGTCGGCQLQHWAGAPYRAWKRGLVAAALARAGVVAEVGALINAEGAGRRRARLHATAEAAGFAGLRSHEIVAIDRCPILEPALAEAPAIARAIARLTGPADIAFTASQTGLDVAVSGKAGRSKRSGFAEVARRFDLARISQEGEILVQRRAPVLTMGRAAVALPPGTFLQATGRAEEVLSDAVVRLVGKAKRVADLFCGIGPFALRLAESAQVFAADADGAAIQALDTALQATPGLRRLGAEKRDLYRDPLVAEEMSRFEAIVLDPPRAGAEAQCREIARSEVKRVVMVSCDPGTFARDARILCEAGFVAGEVTPVDQFRYSAHVEVVAGFRRGKRG